MDQITIGLLLVIVGAAGLLWAAWDARHEVNAMAEPAFYVDRLTIQWYGYRSTRRGAYGRQRVSRWLDRAERRMPWYLLPVAAWQVDKLIARTHRAAQRNRDRVHARSMWR